MQRLGPWIIQEQEDFLRALPEPRKGIPNIWSWGEKPCVTGGVLVSGGCKNRGGWNGVKWRRRPPKNWRKHNFEEESPLMREGAPFVLVGNPAGNKGLWSPVAIAVPTSRGDLFNQRITFPVQSGSPELWEKVGGGVVAGNVFRGWFDYPPTPAQWSSIGYHPMLEATSNRVVSVTSDSNDFLRLKAVEYGGLKLGLTDLKWHVCGHYVSTEATVVGDTAVLFDGINLRRNAKLVAQDNEGHELPRHALSCFGKLGYAGGKFYYLVGSEFSGLSCPLKYPKLWLISDTPESSGLVSLVSLPEKSRPLAKTVEVYLNGRRLSETYVDAESAALLPTAEHWIKKNEERRLELIRLHGDALPHGWEILSDVEIGCTVIYSQKLKEGWMETGAWQKETERVAGTLSPSLRKFLESNNPPLRHPRLGGCIYAPFDFEEILPKFLNWLESNEPATISFLRRMLEPEAVAILHSSVF